MLHVALLVIFTLFAHLKAEPKPNPSPAKTSDLVMVSGGQSQERLKSEQLLEIDGKNGYVIRSFSISPRANINMPQEFHIWSRGMGDVYFF